MCTGSHAFIPATNTLEVRLNFATAGGVAQNVLHFRKSGTPVEADLVQLAEDIYDWYDTWYQTYQSNTITLRSIVVTDLTVEDGMQIEYTTGLPATGAQTPAPFPDNVTVAIKHTTAFRGRSFRGRTYFVGLVNGSTVTADTLSTTWQGYLENIFDALLSTPFTTNDEEFVIVSYCGNGSWRTSATVTPVTNNSLDADLDSMRRRLKGRGI